MLLLNTDWDEYELIDSGNGKRLERFGNCILIRPDPQAIWKPNLLQEWMKVDAEYKLSSDKNDKGGWSIYSKTADNWEMSYRQIKLKAKLTPFKHTGIFPEQKNHWDWISSKINNQEDNIKNSGKALNILNLFGYTGASTLVCASLGASVTHVDASRPTIGWARENQSISNLSNKPIRWILDDASKFVKREVRRGIRYDGIIMDPPVFGHGPSGEVWDFQKNISELLMLCSEVLSEEPLFVIINAYAISASSVMLKNLLEDLQLSGAVEYGELALKERSGRFLSTGLFARWSR